MKRIQQRFNQRQDGLTVVLEDMHYPHNAQAALRSCEAFALQDIHFIFDSQPYYNPRKIGKKSSASANRWLSFHTHSSTRECLETLEKEGHEIIVTVMPDAAEENLYEAEFASNKIAVLFGNERDGVSQTALDMAHRRVTIPMMGFASSLNLSVTTALFLYEITRQRIHSNSLHPISREKSRHLFRQFTQLNNIISK